MSLKVRRDFESKIHEHLYNNLYLLSKFYPPSADFNRIFKPDMFAKNNKAAFHEVIYYLLSILTPQQTKEKLTMWPPYDIQRETKFRAEVLSYVNELNTLFDYAKIPHIMQSHLICPGGFKFTKFMLKLSELVVFEHLKKHNGTEFYYPVHTDGYKFIINYLNKQTAAIDFLVYDQMDEFHNYYNKNQNTAEKVVDKLTEVTEKIVQANKENEIAKKQFNEKYPSYSSQKDLLEKMQYLHKEWTYFQPTHDLYKLCTELLNHVKNKSVILEYKKEYFRIPNEVIHIIKDRDQLDLIELFEGLNVILKYRALDSDNLTKSSIDSNIEKINQMTLKYTNLYNKFTKGKSEICKALQELLDVLVLRDHSSSELLELTMLVPLINNY